MWSATYLRMHGVVSLKREEFEGDADSLLWTQEDFRLEGLCVGVEHALLHRRVDLVNHLKVAPLARICDHPGTTLNNLQTFVNIPRLT